MVFFFFQAEDGIRDYKVTGVQTCALPILSRALQRPPESSSWGAAASKPGPSRNSYASKAAAARSMVTVSPARPASRHSCAYVLSAGRSTSRRVRESRTVSPRAIVPRAVQRGGLPCAGRAPGASASSATSLHSSMSPRNLRALAAAHNLGGGSSEVRHDGDAEGASLRRVLRAATRRHQEAAPPEPPPRLDVAQAITYPAATSEVEAEGGLGLAEQQHPRLATLARSRDVGMVRTEVGAVEPGVMCRQELREAALHGAVDRKSTRLNSSHLVISYAVFCLKKKNKHTKTSTS